MARSLAIYHDPRHKRRLLAFYAGLVEPGDLCFDVGSHVGDRASVLSSLGCRVVAVEAQPGYARLLRLLLRNKPVEVVHAAVAAESGTVTMNLSPAHPTVATGSSGFAEAIKDAPSFAMVGYHETVTVPAVTLDQLVERFGTPAFVKLDVEGMEAEALAGLSRPVPLVSFEVVAAHRPAAFACLDRLAEIGPYRFDLSLGEDARLRFGSWRPRAELEAWLASQPADGWSGDVHAKLEDARDEA